MRKFIFFLLTATAIITTSAYAGPGRAGHSHDHAISVTEAQAIESATLIISTNHSGK